MARVVSVNASCFDEAIHLNFPGYWGNYCVQSIDDLVDLLVICLILVQPRWKKPVRSRNIVGKMMA